MERTHRIRRTAAKKRRRHTGPGHGGALRRRDRAQQPAAPADARKQCLSTPGIQPCLRAWSWQDGSHCAIHRRLRRAPDAEWVLMYRLGLSRTRIAESVCAEPVTVGYHLVIARRQDPGLKSTTGPPPAPLPSLTPPPWDLARMAEVISWVLVKAGSPRTVPVTGAKGLWRAGCPTPARSGPGHPGPCLQPGPGPGAGVGREPQGSNGRGQVAGTFGRARGIRCPGP